MSERATETSGRIDWSALPELLARPALRDRLGIKRADIDRIFDRPDVYRLPGSSKRDSAFAAQRDSHSAGKLQPPRIARLTPRAARE